MPRTKVSVLAKNWGLGALSGRNGDQGICEETLGFLSFLLFFIFSPCLFSSLTSENMKQVYVFLIFGC